MDDKQKVELELTKRELLTITVALTKYRQLQDLLDHREQSGSEIASHKSRISRLHSKIDKLLWLSK